MNLSNLPQAISQTHLKQAWEYHNADGQRIMIVCRYDKPEERKRFVPYHCDEKGEWVSGAINVPYPLYGLSSITKLDPVVPLLIVEGEKCAAALYHLELAATTAPFGAKAADLTDWTPLRSFREFIILPDQDHPGQGYAVSIAKILHRLNPDALIWTCNLPDLKEGQDLVDWLQNQEGLAGWDGFSPLDPDVAKFLKIRLERIIEEYKQKFSQRVEASSGTSSFQDPPKKISDVFTSVPIFPEAALPSLLWKWCENKTRSFRIAPDFFCATHLVALGSLIGRKRQMHPEKNNPDWVVTPNLWGFVVGRSGTSKTPAMAQVVKGLTPFIDSALTAYKQELGRYESLKLQAQSNKTELPSLPVCKRYKTDDPTIEALGPILRDNPQGILLFRDELTGWIKGMNKKGHENDRAFFLEGWNASNSFTTDRIGRGLIHIPAMCLSVFGGIQPGPLSGFMQQMHAGRDWDDGFFQRFQIMVWPRDVEWQPYLGQPNDELDHQIQEIYLFLDKLDFDSQEKPIVVDFSEEAQGLFNAWNADLQRRIRSNDLPEYMVSHLSKYPKLLCSIALILEYVESALSGSEPAVVSTKSFSMAKLWCQYLEPHALKVYGCNHESLKQNTERLIRKVRDKNIQDGFTIREVYHGHHWAGLSNPEEVQKVCDFAESIGWLSKVNDSSTKRMAYRYYVHPNLLEEVG